MLKNIFIVALLAGFVSGVGISLVQEVTTTPLILQAETHEQAEAPKASLHLAGFVQVHGTEADGHDQSTAGEWGPANGLERFAYTTLANIVVGVGFALLLVASYVIYGGQMSGRLGVIWGMAGYAIFVLLPSLGLSPEAPGSLAAELTARQGWWLAAAGATALGLWLMVFCDGWLLRIAGIIVLAAPHILGAPHPVEMGGPVPAELAARFAAASIVTAAIFWAMLGWLSGTLYQRTAAET
ncbi:MAG: CbtA family protein [Rhodospirillales bacterium]|nr:CbtA family protein [Rhodospirillales bacterium]